MRTLIGKSSPLLPLARLSFVIGTLKRHSCCNPWTEVEVDFIWELNRAARIPDLSIHLTADPITIVGRREGRSLTRLECEHSPNDELAAYCMASNFLTEKGYRVQRIDASRQIEIVADHIGKALQAIPSR